MKLRLFTLLFVSTLLTVAATAQTVSSTPPASRGRVLVPGDEILVKVLGEEQFGFAATVDENGEIIVPFAELPVVAKCRTDRELHGQIKELLKKYLKDPQPTLQVTKPVVYPVTVTGEVNRQMRVELQRKATLIEVLAQAEGIKDEASGEIQVLRPIAPVCGDDAASWRSNPTKRFSLSNINRGGEEVNPVIYPGDVIMVLKARPIWVTGEVMAPQGIYFKEGGITLTQAIAKVSGFRHEARTSAINIQRRKSPDSEDFEYIVANYDLIRKKQQPDIPLQPYDIVLVDAKKDSVGVSVLKFVLGMARTAGTAASTGTGYSVIR